MHPPEPRSRICGSVAGRVENDLFHGHKATVRAAADVDAGAVDLRMGIHESTDQGIENFGIFGRTVFGIFAGSSSIHMVGACGASR